MTARPTRKGPAKTRVPEPVLAYLGRLLELAPDAMVIVDRQAKFVLVNTPAKQMFGYSRGGLSGRPMDVVIPERFRPAHLAHLTRSFKNPQTRPMGAGQKLSATRRNGSEFPVEISLGPLEIEGQVMAVGVIRDLTERKLAEEVLRKSIDLEEQSRQIWAANLLESQLLANLSHELRTPLNSIIGFSEMLYDKRGGPISRKQREFLRHILSSARHLLALAGDVLDITCLAAGKIEFSPKQVELDRLIDETRGIAVRGLGGAQEITVDTEIAADLDHVVLDPHRLNQVLYNYISNALKFTPPGGRVIIRALPEGPDMFRIEVEDTGIGIDPRDIGRLFVKFQRLGSSLEQAHVGAGAGVGLGLALTKLIVEAQGGTVGVRSELGRGSTFYAVLPRVSPR